MDDLTQDWEVFVIFGGAMLLFLSVMGYGMWRDRRDEQIGKKD